jgi:hypothetical protein
MGEFWIGGGAWETLKMMASSAHVYGRPILGAEAFTAGDRERWREHPASIKALGDRAFCEGVNRFVFHRYAMQPWLAYRPGMAMGPWGLHYERTNTWWELAGPWHEYLSRCQYLLRQGTFVADVLYLRPEGAPQEYKWHERNGFDYDDCTPEAALTGMSVRDGRIVLASGMSYRVLALPETARMTPALLRKVGELAAAGATIVGTARPSKAPGLSDYPQCDAEVARLAGELWGRGRIIVGRTPDEVLGAAGVAKDFEAPPGIRWIHRSAAGAEIYFVASNSPQAREVMCSFRVAGLRPELWRPETGAIEPAGVYVQAEGVTRLPIAFEPSGSVFVVFRKPAGGFDPVADVSLDGKSLIPVEEPRSPVRVVKAVYGVPGDPERTRDVKAKLQAFLDAGEFEIGVSRMAAGDDPAYGIVKTLDAEYAVGGTTFNVRGRDPDTITFPLPPAAEAATRVRDDGRGRWLIDADKAGSYELRTARGRLLRAQIPAFIASVPLTGPWDLRFPPRSGAPGRVTLDRPVSWSEHADPGVRHFSGTAAYETTFVRPRELQGQGRRIWLDLGKVQVMAAVKLNGRDLGILWKPPYRVEITDAVKAGENRLEIAVTNLWINRLIGDEELPEDSDRNPDGTLKSWPTWVREGQPSPAGRFTFTSWRLWKKGEPLAESGLIGPVTLRGGARAEAK